MKSNGCIFVSRVVEQSEVFSGLKSCRDQQQQQQEEELKQKIKVRGHRRQQEIRRRSSLV